MFSLVNLALSKIRITNNSSRFATRGSLGLQWVLRLWRNAVAFVLRCSLLNWALVANEKNAAKAECLELKSVCFWWGFVLQF